MIWAGEASVKTLLRLRERVNRGLKDRKIVIIGPKDERDNIEKQLKYSNLFEMDNITRRCQWVVAMSSLNASVGVR